MVFRKLFATEERLKCSKKLYMDNLEEETIKKFSELASIRSKNTIHNYKKCDNLFYFGNWALP